MSTATLPETDTIDSDQLSELRRQDPDIRILDVRSGGEYETVHIPGSYNVPLDTLGEHVRDLASVEHPVVLVCQSGGRATQAHEKLTAPARTHSTSSKAAWPHGSPLTVTSCAAPPNGGPWIARFGLWPDRSPWGHSRSTVVPGAKWLAGGVAAGLTYSAVSNTCTMAAILSKLPYNQTDKCDIAGVVAALNEEAA